VVTRYARSLRDTCAAEIQALKARAVSVDNARLRRWLNIECRLHCLKKNSPNARK
jgi:hypothetical protein